MNRKLLAVLLVILIILGIDLTISYVKYYNQSKERYTVTIEEQGLNSSLPWGVEYANGPTPSWTLINTTGQYLTIRNVTSLQYLYVHPYSPLNNYTIRFDQTKTLVNSNVTYFVNFSPIVYVGEVSTTFMLNNKSYSATSSENPGMSYFTFSLNLQGGTFTLTPLNKSNNSSNIVVKWPFKVVSFSYTSNLSDVHLISLSPKLPFTVWQTNILFTANFTHPDYPAVASMNFTLTLSN